MTLLRPSENQTKYLKVGIMGFAGAGKTRTASLLARGLAGMGDTKRPVAFFDTETGSDFVKPLFDEEGIEMFVAKTRSFADLLTFMREAEEVGAVALIDSITHVWQDVLTAYQRRFKRTRLRFNDWGPIKEQWRDFTDRYVNSQMHVVLCGRAGFEYDLEAGEDGKDLVKTGTKMKAETEMAYEPSLLLEMERVTADVQTFEKGKRSRWVHRCYILKDRNDVMNGHFIDNPTFESFKPVIDRLSLTGRHVGVSTGSRTGDLFDSPESRGQRAKQVEIVLELILDAFVRADMGGTSKEAKRAQVDNLTACFGTSAWTAIKGMRLEDLEAGYVKLQVALGLKEAAPKAPPTDYIAGLLARRGREEPLNEDELEDLRSYEMDS